MKLAIIGFTLALASLAGAMVVDISAAPAHAAPTLAAVTQCALAEQAGNIDVYLCEPDYGAPYRLNSYGFMLPVD